MSDYRNVFSLGTSYVLGNAYLGAKCTFLVIEMIKSPQETEKLCILFHGIQALGPDIFLFFKKFIPLNFFSSFCEM